MRRLTRLVALVLGLATATVEVEAQPIDTEAEGGGLSPVERVRLVGHARVLGLMSTGSPNDAAPAESISWGHDGLIVRWSPDGRPQAWSRIRDTEFVGLSGAGVFAITSEQYTELDPLTLAPLREQTHTGAIRCGLAGTWWTWGEAGPVEIRSRQGVTVVPLAELPDPEAQCMIAGDRSWLYWFDGDSLRAVGSEGTSVSIPWPYPSLRTTMQAQTPAAWRTVDGTVEAWSLADGQALSGSDPVIESSCAAWDADGRSRCVESTTLTREDVLLPQSVLPTHVAPIEQAWLLTVDGGWFILPTDGREILAYSSAGGRALGLTPDGSTLVQCVAGSSSARLQLRAPMTGAVLSERDMPSCELQVDASDAGVVVVSDDMVLVWDGESWTERERGTVVDATAPWGRAGLSFELHRTFDASCPNNGAWSLLRTTTEGEPEPLGASSCGISGRLSPLGGAEGTPTGIVVLVGRPGQWHARGYGQDGALRFEVDYAAEQPDALSWHWIDERPVVDDLEEQRTRAWTGTSWESEPLRLWRGDGEVVWERRMLHFQVGAGATCQGDARGWTCWAPDWAWTSPALAGRAVLVREDDSVVPLQRAPEYLQAGPRLPHPSADLPDSAP